jgi:hypothetical protein
MGAARFSQAGRLVRKVSEGGLREGRPYPDRLLFKSSFNDIEEVFRLHFCVHVGRNQDVVYLEWVSPDLFNTALGIGNLCPWRTIRFP